VSRELARLRPIFEGATVLVVDDDSACRDAFQYLLEDLGATVLVAPDGIAALAVLSEHDPDLVLSDVLMPGLDGYALVRRVREDERRTTLPVIGVSASFAAADQEPGGLFDSGLGKPFDYRDLDKALQQVMRRRPRFFQRQLARLRHHATGWCVIARDVRATARLAAEQRRVAREQAADRVRVLFARADSARTRRGD
jgi:CheY-like chemotaxis protein